jgi:S-adenosylmethionine:tRNA ribosyltransferase-isomerase
VSPAGPGAPGAVPVLRLDDLDYELPPQLVAQTPAEPRDASRLLVYERGADHASDNLFRDLPGLLRAGDVLVRNDTRVFPARSYFRRCTGGRIEALFLRPVPGAAGETWEVLLRGRPQAGELLASEPLGDVWSLRCRRPLGDGRWLVASEAARGVLELLDEAGLTPLPPYIRTGLDDPERYQTTYARVVGSAAAPTAGLHFTGAVDRALADAGIAIETVTLHVGLGTFKPLAEETLTAGSLHREGYEVDAAVWRRLRAARAAGRRLIAVGTTSLRVLETLAQQDAAWPGAGRGEEAPFRGGAAPDAAAGAAPPGVCLTGETDLFIAPGFRFRAAGGLLTNFHLPRTSLLALVMAFCGVEQTRRLYRHAVACDYRFYSFGDAMLAL